MNYRLTDKEIGEEEVLELLKIGEHTKVDAGLFVPLHRMKALAFQYETKQGEAVVHKQMEVCALQLLQRTGLDINVFVVDMGIRSKFLYLDGLSQADVGKITLINSMNELEKAMEGRIRPMAREIDSSVLSFEYKDAHQYNSNRNTEDEALPYTLFLISNFDQLIESSHRGIHDLLELLEASNRYGFIFLFSTTKEDAKAKERNEYMPPSMKNFQRLLNEVAQINLHEQKGKYSFLNADTPNTHSISYLTSRYGFSFEQYSEDDLRDVVKHLRDTKPESLHKDFLSIKIGKSGREDVYLRMGELSEVHHGLIAGQTRMGKSNFLNNIIVSIAENYSCKEIELYLLDYKEGVEFDIYRNHPNARLILTDNSNLSVATEVLSTYTKEIERRSVLFKDLQRKLNIPIKSVSQYNKNADETLPYILLIIDEVQTLFEGEYKIGDIIRKDLETIAKKGAGFGLHFLFSTQSYRGIGELNQAKGQANLRVSFRLGNEDAYAIMPDNNFDFTDLDVGECILNEKNGAKKANQRVKTTFIKGEDILPRLQKAKEKHGISLNTEVREKAKAERAIITEEQRPTKDTKKSVEEDLDDIWSV